MVVGEIIMGEMMTEHVLVTITIIRTNIAGELTVHLVVVSLNMLMNLTVKSTTTGTSLLSQWIKSKSDGAKPMIKFTLLWTNFSKNCEKSWPTSKKKETNS